MDGSVSLSPVPGTPAAAKSAVEASQLLSPRDRRVKYQVLVTRMNNLGCSEQEIDDTLDMLEKQVGEIQGIYSDFVPDKQMVRNWLAKIINKQIKAKTRKDDFVHFTVDIGREEFHDLINANNTYVKFKVTAEAMRVLFHSRSSLNGFIEASHEIQNFAFAVSPNNTTEEMMGLFAADRFVTVNEKVKTDVMATALFNTSVKSIWTQLPPKISNGVDENAAKRDVLIAQLKVYIKSPSDIVNKLILNTNEDGKDKNGRAAAFDYLEGFRGSALLISFSRVLYKSGKLDKDFQVVPNKIINENKVISQAGDAALQGLLSHYAATGGDKNDIFDISRTRNDKVAGALVFAAADLALSKEGWPDNTTVGPNGSSFKDYIHLLKTDPTKFLSFSTDKPEKVDPDQFGLQDASKLTATPSQLQ